MPRAFLTAINPYFIRVLDSFKSAAPTYKQYFYHIIFLSCKMCIFTSFQKVHTGCKSLLCPPSNQVFMWLYDNSFLSCHGRQIIFLSFNQLSCKWLDFSKIKLCKSCVKALFGQAQTLCLCGLRTHVHMLPQQTNSTFIIIFFLNF